MKKIWIQSFLLVDPFSLGNLSSFAGFGDLKSFWDLGILGSFSFGSLGTLLGRRFSSSCLLFSFWFAGASRLSWFLFLLSRGSGNRGLSQSNWNDKCITSSYWRCCRSWGRVSGSWLSSFRGLGILGSFACFGNLESLGGLRSFRSFWLLGNFCLALWCASWLNKNKITADLPVAFLAIIENTY